MFQALSATLSSFLGSPSTAVHPTTNAQSPAPTASTSACATVGSAVSPRVSLSSVAGSSRGAVPRAHARSSSVPAAASALDIWGALDERSPEPSIRKADKGKGVDRGPFAPLTATQLRARAEALGCEGDDEQDADEESLEESHEGEEDEDLQELMEEDSAFPTFDPTELGDDWLQKLNKIVRKQHKSTLDEFEEALDLARGAVLEMTLAKSSLKDEIEEYQQLLSNIGLMAGQQYADYMDYLINSDEDAYEGEPVLQPRPVTVHRSGNSDTPSPPHDLPSPVLDEGNAVDGRPDELNDGALPIASSPHQGAKRDADEGPPGEGRPYKRVRISQPTQVTPASEQPLDNVVPGIGHRFRKPVEDRSPTPARPVARASIRTPRFRASNAGASSQRGFPPRSSPGVPKSPPDYEEEEDVAPPSDLPIASSDSVGFDPNDSRAFDPVDVRHVLSSTYAQRPSAAMIDKTREIIRYTEAVARGDPQVDSPVGMQHPEVDDADALPPSDSFEPAGDPMPSSGSDLPSASNAPRIVPISEDLHPGSISQFLRRARNPNPMDPFDDAPAISRRAGAAGRGQRHVLSSVPYAVVPRRRQTRGRLQPGQGSAEFTIEERQRSLWWGDGEASTFDGKAGDRSTGTIYGLDMSY